MLITDCKYIHLKQTNAPTHFIACHWRADFFNGEEGQSFFIAVDSFCFNRLSDGHATIGYIGVH